MVVWPFDPQIYLHADPASYATRYLGQYRCRKNILEEVGRKLS